MIICSFSAPHCHHPCRLPHDDFMTCITSTLLLVDSPHKGQYCRACFFCCQPLQPAAEQWSCQCWCTCGKAEMWRSRQGMNGFVIHFRWRNLWKAWWPILHRQIWKRPYSTGANTPLRGRYRAFTICWYDDAPTELQQNCNRCPYWCVSARKTSAMELRLSCINPLI